MGATGSLKGALGTEGVTTVDDIGIGSKSVIGESCLEAGAWMVGMRGTIAGGPGGINGTMGEWRS